MLHEYHRGRRAAGLFLLLLLGAQVASAQIESGAIILSGALGPADYLGEFNSFDGTSGFSPINGYEADLSLKYNVAWNFSILALVGTHHFGYDVTTADRVKYASNFFGPVDGTTYPGTTVDITPRNHISTMEYLVMGQSHFDFDSRLVPYFTLGIGYMTFTPTNDKGDVLPTNVTGDYATGAVIMPLGIGAEYFLNDRLSIFAQYLFTVNSTDYLDGYAHYLQYESSTVPQGQPGTGATPSDYMMSLTVGASFTLYQPGSPTGPELPPKESEPTRPTPPRPAATSAPNSSPAAEMDSDNDGLSDRSEVERYRTDPHNPDSDGDGLSDGEEILRYDTSPNNSDTDGDSLTDGAEVLIYHTDPLNRDTDRDLLSDGDEVNRVHTLPLIPDTDEDGVIDGRDECPLEPGTPANHGCPEGVRPYTPAKPMAGIGDYVQTNDRMDFQGIYFQVNSDNFDFSNPATAANLTRLRDYMQQCDDIGVLIEGHTSSEGNPSWNDRLSARRAQRVRSWLIANGVAPRKILGTVGYGGRLPKVEEPAPGTVSNAELEWIRSQNRRITALVRKPCNR